MLLEGGVYEPMMAQGTLVFNALDPLLIEMFVQEDPYMKAGLIQFYRINEFPKTIYILCSLKNDFKG